MSRQMAVRREAVRLEVEDHFTREILQAAAAVQVLDKSLASLSGSATTSQRSVVDTDRDVDSLGRTSRRTSADINQLSGRLSILARAFATLGPAISPITAVGVAGVAGLASQLGFAAVGALSLVAAAQGVGDALEAVNEAALEPTAANLEKARQALAKIGPEAQAFVMRFQELRPILGDLRDAAAAGWFPGLTDALDSLEQGAPAIERILSVVSKAGGDLVGDAAASLVGPRWREFFDFVEAEAPQALTNLGESVGALTHGLAELWMAFDPVNDATSNWLLDVSRGFDEWAGGLSETQGFRDFLTYVRDNGPRVADAAAAIGNAVLQIGEAAAPLGGPVLQALTAVANAIAAIADSPLGTPLIALASVMSAANLAAMALNGTLRTLGITSAATGAQIASSKAGIIGLTAAFLGLAAAGSETQGAMSDVRTEIALGDLDAARDKLETLNERIADWKDFRTTSGFGDFFSDASKVFTDFDDALNWTFSSVGGSGIEGMKDEAALLEKQISDLEAAQDGATDSTTGLAGAQRETSQATKNLTAAIEQQASATLSAFDAETRWRQALNAARDAAGKNTAGIRGNSDAALANREVLSNLAGAWQNQSAAVRANQGRLASARRAFIDTATSMGVPIREARRLANAIIGIPAKKAVTITVEQGRALSAVDQLKRELAGIQSKTVTVTINGRRTGATVGTPGDFGNLIGGSADGSTVPKDGGPYADRYPYLLAPGEEVISNRYGQADRHRGLLKAINAGRLADGGTVRSSGTDMRWTSEAREAGRALKDLARSARASSVQLDRAKDRRASLLSARSDLAGSVRDGLSSDIFGGSDWGDGDPNSVLRADIGNARAFRAAIRTLRGRGVRGDALAEIIRDGNLQRAQSMAGQSRAYLADYNRLYSARAREVGAAGSAAGNARYGAQIERVTREIRELRAEVRRSRDRNSEEHDKNRKSNRAGARRAASSRSRGDVRMS